MIILIAAMTKDRVIGKEGKIPWHCPEDQKVFKSLTTGNTVLMGRNTYDSLPAKFRPLPNRRNIVITRRPIGRKNDEVFYSTPSIEDGLSWFSSSSIPDGYNNESFHDLFVIGGESIYRWFIENDQADYAYISLMNKEVEGGDTFFPNFAESWEVACVTDYKDFKLFELRR